MVSHRPGRTAEVPRTGVPGTGVPGDDVPGDDAPASGGAPVGHEPVLVDEVCDLLRPALERLSPALVVDATLGLGGHCAAVLGCHPQAVAVGVDRDPQALARAAERLAPFGSRARIIHGTLGTFDASLRAAGWDPATRPVAAAVVDLGVSSFQLDTADRGFSYARDAPLDMRMDPRGGVTAADVVNTYEIARLARLLRENADERWAARIAAAIGHRRQRAAFTGTGELAELVRAAIPAAARREGGNPAKRTFQALRIEVNDELGQLRSGLPQVLAALAPHGRCVVLSYHSGEDRLVKAAFGALTARTMPIGVPLRASADEAPAVLLTRGAVRPSAAETAANPRARSARLRAVERVR